MRAHAGGRVRGAGSCVAAFRATWWERAGGRMAGAVPLAVVAAFTRTPSMHAATPPSTPSPLPPIPLHARSPSALGLVCGVVYMAFIIVTQLVYVQDRHELVSDVARLLLWRGCYWAWLRIVTLPHRHALGRG